MLRIPSLLRNAAYSSKMLQAASVRHLNLHEYQSKQLMADGGVTVQRFKVADTSAQARDIAQSVKYDEFVVKAQVLAGGRGKGTLNSGLHGGVKLTRDPAQVVEFVEKMLGYRLVTKQTPKEGVMVKKVMIAEALDIKRETYLAILMDRTFNGPVVVASPAGGVDIEEVAEKTPELIFKQPVDINTGLTDDQALSIAKNLQFEGSNMKDAAEQIKKLYQVFRKADATMVEINPFGETPDGKVVCFDAKINFDDNAQFRQKEIFAQEDHAESDPREVEAAKWNLNYIGMDGNIASLVNGAGLAMATMDIIKLHGGNPANFLDVGEEQVAEAFRILTQDPKVKAILVNVFGGVVNCATNASLMKSLGKIATKVAVYALKGFEVGFRVLACMQVTQCLGSSMEPTIQTGDLIVVEELTKFTKPFGRGDIVICRSPSEPSVVLCKRLIGLPGDLLTSPEIVQIVPKGRVWLEGDNKRNSYDSRSFGAVPMALLRGRAIFNLNSWKPLQ